MKVFLQLVKSNEDPERVLIGSTFDELQMSVPPSVGEEIIASDDSSYNVLRRAWDPSMDVVYLFVTPRTL